MCIADKYWASLRDLGTIAPVIDISMFNIKYLAKHKVQMHAGAISKSLGLHKYGR